MVGRSARSLLIGVCLALAPLVAGCGGQSPAAGPTVAPMRVGAPAQWRQVNPPPGASKLTSLAVSPVDGADAWDCEPADPYTYLIWASTDAGAHWRRAGAIAASHEANATPPIYCRLYTDQANPQVLAADFAYLPRPPDPKIPAGYDLSYLSQDGGVTWRPVPGRMQVEALATSGSSLYALVDDTSVAVFKPHVIVSANSLETWRTVPLPAASVTGAAMSGTVNRLYGGPGADGLIVIADGLPLEHLNFSTGSWTPIHLSTFTARELQNVPMPITWLPTQHTWMICAGTLNAASPQRTGLLRCTTNDGATWRDRPFPTTASGAPLQAANSGWACVPSTLTNVGALLAWCETTAVNTTPGISSMLVPKPGHLLRLALASSQWVDLGPLGGGDFGINALGRVVWSFGANDTAWAADLSGPPA
ncbi:MAG TPA: hypothetical protein VF725_01885 [Ktedonobacterales bacterium]